MVLLIPWLNIVETNIGIQKLKHLSPLVAFKLLKFDYYRGTVKSKSPGDHWECGFDTDIYYISSVF